MQEIGRIRRCAVKLFLVDFPGSTDCTLFMLNDLFIQHIASELSIELDHVREAIELFDRGASIPFVARYRKDRVGNLTESKLSAIEEANRAGIALYQRRTSLIQNMEKQGEVPTALREAVERCVDPYELEDLYTPSRLKPRNAAVRALEAGLEPLADRLHAPTENESPTEAAQGFLAPDKQINTPEEALAGAQAILSDRFARDAALRGRVRATFLESAILRTTGSRAVGGTKTKFDPFFDFSESLKTIPRSKLCTIFRGARDGLLRLEMTVDDEALQNDLVTILAGDSDSDARPYLCAALRDAYERTLRPAIESDVLAILHQRADHHFLRTLGQAVRRLLMAPPVPGEAVIGVTRRSDNLYAVAAVDKTGAHCGDMMIALDDLAASVERVREVLAPMIERYDVSIFATAAGPESQKILRLLRRVASALDQRKVRVGLVSNVGLTTYSTSTLACSDFPDLDPSLRAAISIARRVQDPLAEFTKVEPRLLASGMHHHGIHRKVLQEAIEKTIASCVNRVGADVNRAAAQYLSYVSGLQAATAENIVAYRQEHGPFRSREQLLEVDGVGPKVYEQCIGFLRIGDGENPLDATRIHPDAYPVVQGIAESLSSDIPSLIGNRELLRKHEYAAPEASPFGKHTLEDIGFELSKPGRDPRGTYRAPKSDDRSTLTEMKPGEIIEGIVTNITEFGAFVDVGLEQDGLVHLSELANRYVAEPREIVHIGQTVRVKVTGVDTQKPRLSLSLKGAEKGKPSARATRPPRRDAAEARKRPVQNRATDHKRPKTGNREKPRRKPERDSRPPRELINAKSAPMNTQLADQLAALKDKFTS